MLTYTAPPGTLGSLDQCRREAEAMVKFCEENYRIYLEQFPRALEGAAQCVAPVDGSMHTTACDDTGSLVVITEEVPDVEVEQ